MSDNNSATAAHIDEQQLDVFLHRYFNLSLPVGSVSTILTEVFNALIAAGVVLFDDGTPGSDVQITVHGGRMVMTKPDPQTGQEVTTWWTPQGGMPSVDRAIRELVTLLTAILASSPWTGKTDWPYTRN